MGEGGESKCQGGKSGNGRGERERGRCVDGSGGRGEPREGGDIKEGGEGEVG